jgi:hypothetical protein
MENFGAATVPTLNERDYYARRAIEVRGFAAVARDPEIKHTLEQMAESYATLVEEADRIARLRTALDEAGGYPNAMCARPAANGHDV